MRSSVILSFCRNRRRVLSVVGYDTGGVERRSNGYGGRSFSATRFFWILGRSTTVRPPRPSCQGPHSNVSLTDGCGPSRSPRFTSRERSSGHVPRSEQLAFLWAQEKCVPAGHLDAGLRVHGREADAAGSQELTNVLAVVLGGRSDGGTRPSYRVSGTAGPIPRPRLTASRHDRCPAG
jgi:hypothetical protein